MKIALVGSAPSSVGLAPFRDKHYADYIGGKPVPQYPPSQYIGEEWSIWGCSPGAYGHAQRADRWFELHRWEPGAPWFSPEYVQFIKEFRGAMYVGAPIPDLPNATVYPLERVETEFSAFFLTSSLAQMCALAILEIEDYRKAHPEHDHNEDVIAFAGVDMAANEEWNEQRPGCQFFIMQALERGIGIIVPPESDLTRPMPVYGICEHDHAYIKMTARMRELNSRLQGAQQVAQQKQQEMNFLQGAIDDLNYCIKTWLAPKEYGLPTGVVIRKAPKVVQQIDASLPHVHKGNGAHPPGDALTATD